MTSTAPHQITAHSFAQPSGEAEQSASAERQASTKHQAQTRAPNSDGATASFGVDHPTPLIERDSTGDRMRESVAALVRQDSISHHATDLTRGPGGEGDPQVIAPGLVEQRISEQGKPGRNDAQATTGAMHPETASNMTAPHSPVPVPTFQALFTDAQMPDPKSLFPLLLNTLCVSGHAITMAELRNETILLALDGFRFAFIMDAGNLPRSEDLYRPDLSFASLPAARLALALRNGTWSMMIEVEDATPDGAVQAATDAVFSLVSPQVVVWTQGQLALSAAEYATMSLSELVSLERGPRLPRLRHRYERPAMTPGPERRSVFAGPKQKHRTTQSGQTATPRTASDEGPTPPSFPPVPTKSARQGRSRKMLEQDGQVGPVSRDPGSNTLPGTSAGLARAPDIPATDSRTARKARDNRFAVGGALCDAFTIDIGANQPQLVTTMLVTASLGLKIGTLMLSAMGASTGTL